MQITIGASDESFCLSAMHIKKFMTFRPTKMLKKVVWTVRTGLVGAVYTYTHTPCIPEQMSTIRTNTKSQKKKTTMHLT